MKKYMLIAVAGLLPLIMTACQNEDSNDSADGNNAQIYTTVFPLASFAEQIGGDTVDVESIYPNGVDVHTYEPTQKDMIDYADGDLFIYTTDGFDAVAENIKSSIGEETEFLASAEGITEDEIVEHSHSHGDDGEDHDHAHHETGDSHVWLDPVLSQVMAEAIKDKLIELNPEEEALYTDNYEALVSDLEDIDQELQDITEDPKRNSVYLSHESIGYLADRYHFDQIGVSGMNNESASQQELTQMIEDIEETGTPYLLYEQNVTSRVTETIQNETDTEPLYFHNMSVLTDEDDDDATYQSIMRDNIEILDKALNE